MQTTIKFAKVKESAIIPSKRDEDAGFDMYACFDEDYMLIRPHETVLVPTGIASSCDKSYCLILKERGSTGSKGIALRCGVVDSGYRNEIFVCLTNTTNKQLFISKLSKEELMNYLETDCWTFSDEDICVYPYAKAIAQAIVLPVPAVTVEEITYDELQLIASERGKGALGSSNK